MKHIIVFLALAISLPVVAEQKTDFPTIEMDFAILCETSKMATALSRKKALSAVDLAERMSSMLEHGLRSKEVQTARTGINGAPVKTRKSLWENAARELGLRDWKCPTVGNL